MIRYGALDEAVTVYTQGDVHEAIPVEYYRQVMKLAIQMNNNGKHWDMQQSAAVLVYLAFSNGYLKPSQLTSSGLSSLDHAEKLLQDNDLLDRDVSFGHDSHAEKVVLKLLG